MGYLGKIVTNPDPFGKNTPHALLAAQMANQYKAPESVNSNQVNTAYGQTQSGLGQQQAFIDALNAQNGIGNQNAVFAQQQALANQLGQQALGQGPNPAMAQLNQATGQNVANQAALMAGQRGSSANAGLIARQAGMQGGNLQQQAVGQGATMAAQQQLAAQQALQQQQAQMANVAGNQVGQQGNALSNYNQLAQGEQGQLLNAVNQQNQLNAGVAAGNTAAKSQLYGGMLGAAGSLMAMNKGGSTTPKSNYTSSAGNYVGADNTNTSGMMVSAHGGEVPGQAEVKGDSPKNDKVAAVLSPNEIVIPRSITMHPDAPWLAAKFVAEQIAKHKGDGSGKYAFGSDGMVDDEGPEEGVNTTEPNNMMQSPTQATLGAPIQGGLNGPMDYRSSGDYANQLLTGAQEQGAAAHALAAAQGQAGQAQAGALQKGINALEPVAKEQEGMANAFKDAPEQFIAAQRDYMNSPGIDPHHYLGSKSTAGKIGTAIGIILGGIGAGMTGKSNVAMEFLQKSIDNDIQAQKDNLSKKSTVYSMALQKYKNHEDALAATKATLLQQSALEAQKAVANSQNPIEKAKADAFALQVNQQANMTALPLKQKSEIWNGIQSGQVKDPMIASYLLPENERAKGIAEAAQSKDLTLKKAQAMKAWDSMANEGTISKGLTTTPAESELNKLIEPLAKENGRINPDRVKTITDTYPKWYRGGEGANNKTDLGKRRQIFEQTWDDAIKKASPTWEANGLPLNKFQVTNPSDRRNSYKPGDVVNIKGKSYQVGADGNSLQAVK